MTTYNLFVKELSTKEWAETGSIAGKETVQPTNPSAASFISSSSTLKVDRAVLTIPSALKTELEAGTKIIAAKLWASAKISVAGKGLLIAWEIKAGETAGAVEFALTTTQEWFSSSLTKAQAEALTAASLASGHIFLEHLTTKKTEVFETYLEVELEAATIKLEGKSAIKIGGTSKIADELAVKGKSAVAIGATGKLVLEEPLLLKGSTGIKVGQAGKLATRMSLSSSPTTVVVGAKGKLALTGGGISGIVTAIRQRPPLALNVLVETPGNVRRRWGWDDPNPIYAPKDMTFSTVMPGGFERFGCVLERNPAITYPDIREMSTLTTFGVGGSTAWQGRIEKTPDTAGFQAQVNPEAVGWQAHLEDDESVREIYVDAELARWEGADTGRKIKLLNESIDEEDATVTTSVGGSAVPALATSLTGAWARERFSEGWYDAKGIPLAALRYAWELIAEGKVGQSVTTDTNWTWAAGLSSDDLGTVVSGSGNLRAAGPTGTGTVESSGGPPWAFTQLIYAIGSGEDGVTYVVYWPVLAVYGKHGLPLQGTLTAREWPGLLASDVVAHAIRKWAPEIGFTLGPEGTIQESAGSSVGPTAFVIPQLAFLEATKVAEIIKQATRFELPDWAVWEGPLFYMNERGARGNKWRARVGPAQLQEAGPQASRLWNGVVVQYTDVTGKTRSVGPPGFAGPEPGSEDSLLLDSNPESVLNEKGIKKWAHLTMGTSTKEGAKAVGRIFLAEQKRAEMSGQASLVGHVEDEKGNLHPAWAVRGGDEISFTDAAEPAYRRIVSTSYDDNTKTNAIQLDQPSDHLQALLERLSVAIQPFGFS